MHLMFCFLTDPFKGGVLTVQEFLNAAKQGKWKIFGPKGSLNASEKSRRKLIDFSVLWLEKIVAIFARHFDSLSILCNLVQDHAIPRIYFLS